VEIDMDIEVSKTTENVQVARYMFPRR